MRRIRDESADLIARAELEALHYSKQLSVLHGGGFPATAILNHKKWIARALLLLGDYKQARAMVKDDPQLSRVMAEITEIEEAVAEPDDAYCDCTHIVDMNPAERGKEQLRELSSYAPTGRKTRSAKHGGKLVELYKCVKCGYMNALPEPPDEALKTAQSLRAATDRAFAPAARRRLTHREAPPEFTNADHLHFPKSDAKTPTT